MRNRPGEALVESGRRGLHSGESAFRGAGAECHDAALVCRMHAVECGHFFSPRRAATHLARRLHEARTSEAAAPEAVNLAEIDVFSCPTTHPARREIAERLRTYRVRGQPCEAARTASNARAVRKGITVILQSLQDLQGQRRRLGLADEDEAAAAATPPQEQDGEEGEGAQFDPLQSPEASGVRVETRRDQQMLWHEIQRRWDESERAARGGRQAPAVQQFHSFDSEKQRP